MSCTSAPQVVHPFTHMQSVLCSAVWLGKCMLAPLLKSHVTALFPPAALTAQPASCNVLQSLSLISPGCPLPCTLLSRLEMRSAAAAKDSECVQHAGAKCPLKKSYLSLLDIAINFCAALMAQPGSKAVSAAHQPCSSRKYCPAVSCCSCRCLEHALLQQFRNLEN